MKSLLTFLQTFAVMYAVSLLPIALYALRKAGRDFDPFGFVILNRGRLVLAAVVVLLLSVVILYVPESAEILRLVGFNGERSPALGFAVGALLVTSISKSEV